MLKIFTLVLIIPFYSLYSECVEEVTMTGSELMEIKNTDGFYIELNQAFKKISTLKKLNPEKMYTVQINQHDRIPYLKDYDDKYLKYYDLESYAKWISQVESSLKEADYQLEVIGQSVQGRDLYAIYPLKIDPNKKTILMLGRQHGDEGTANYLIEGFVEKFISKDNRDWLNDYQLILYPMINPDGAHARVRYNANDLDLNRNWSQNPENEKDEIFVVHNHLRKFWNDIGKSTFIVLDMHGSIREDFIFRVKRSYRGKRFFRKQGLFISRLGRLDKWQNGRSKLTNGKPKMARIVFIRDYKKNALTHETIKNILKKSNQSRSLDSLRKQGVAIYNTLKKYY